MNLAEPMVAALADDLEALAFEYLDSSGEGAVAQTRGDLFALAQAWRRLFEKHGLETGDEIALSPSRGPHLPALHLAALADGLAIVPLNSALTPAEIEGVLSDARVKLVVSSEEVVERNRSIAAELTEAGVSWLAESEVDADQASGNFEVRHRDGDDTAMTIYTSGTTGEPKSVPLTHAGLLANLEALSQVWHRSSQDRLLHVLPAHHYHGLVLGVYGSLLAASPVVMMSSFDARSCLDAIRAHRINLFMAVPTMYSRMLSVAEPGDSLDGLRLAISGSAPLPVSLWKSFSDRFRVPLVNRYGLTETGIATSTLPEAPRAGSVGLPLPGTTVGLLCEGRYVGACRGKRSPLGEICMAGPTVTEGYGNNPEATDAAIHDGYFHSGDLGYFDEGGHLFVEGRIKELIIVGGSNVIPGEVAEVLAKAEGVEDVAVVGEPDEDLGEIVAAYVVASAAQRDQTTEAEIEASLREAAAKGLARYKQPRVYRFIGEIPRNPTGKVDRARLLASAS